RRHAQSGPGPAVPALPGNDRRPTPPAGGSAMTLTRLLFRNLRYHWRGNVAVFLGVVVGTAVMTGALLVGDSLRGSLRDLALDQLGGVDEALVANRFFREKLADEVSAGRTCPVLILQGSATRGGDAPG